MNWGKKRVVVTGAAGFLGSHLSEALVSKGAHVVACDNSAVGRNSSLVSIADKIDFVECDIRNRDSLVPFMKNSDIVFHLAAVANPRACKENFDLAFAVNVEGTKNVLDASQSCERLIFMSNAGVYGSPEYVPVDEEHPLKGKAPYSITKIMGEYLCRNYYENCKTPVTVVRNFNTFGPRQTLEYIVPTLITQALSDNKVEVWSLQPYRDFTFVDDTIDALLRIAETPELVGEAVNLGSGMEIQIASLARKISEMMGGIPVVDLDRKVTDGGRLTCNNKKLKQKTGWVPRISFEEGLRRTIEWYKARFCGG